MARLPQAVFSRHSFTTFVVPEDTQCLPDCQDRLDPKHGKWPHGDMDAITLLGGPESRLTFRGKGPKFADAGVVQWQNESLPSLRCGFDPRRPLQIRGKEEKDEHFRRRSRF